MVCVSVFERDCASVSVLYYKLGFLAQDLFDLMPPELQKEHTDYWDQKKRFDVSSSLSLIHSFSLTVTFTTTLALTLTLFLAFALSLLLPPWSRLRVNI